MSVSKNDIIRKVRDNLPGVTSNGAESVISTTFEVMKEKLLQGEDISIHSFGSFKVKRRAARVGRNPLTGATIDIPEKITVRFTPSKNFKEELN